MLQQDEPDDYVIATGETHSVKDFIDLAFSHVGMELTWEGEGVDRIAKDQNGVVRVRINFLRYRLFVDTPMPVLLQVQFGRPHK